jgi:hypothetical protein
MVGLKKGDLFITIDLYENKDITIVLSHLTVIRRLHMNGELKLDSKKTQAGLSLPQKDPEKQKEIERERIKRRETEKMQEIEQHRAQDIEKERAKIVAQEKYRENERNREADRQQREKDKTRQAEAQKEDFKFSQESSSSSSFSSSPQKLEIPRENSVGKEADSRAGSRRGSSVFSPTTTSSTTPITITSPAPLFPQSGSRRARLSDASSSLPVVAGRLSPEPEAEYTRPYHSSSRASVTSLADDLAAKEMIKYDPNLERKAKKWIEVR